MTNISVRSDDYSIQITSPRSKRFFIRVADPAEITEKVTITDFMFDENDSQFVFEALQYLNEELPAMFRAQRWIFLDLLPIRLTESSVGLDHPELVGRFDQLKDLLRGFLQGSSIAVENAYLEPRSGKFDAVFELASLRSSQAGLLARLLGM